eukprot:TRINITY_DN69987_c0_g1_i1.p1 TRINITY_DN69987_c0_g1~~TRINITY_DN69987_c0_g1_i1.p1  ORF type:complete len:303 (+),score=98.06 TRINITY_DN69987_c0_g1_i1:93-911(+)
MRAGSPEGADRWSPSPGPYDPYAPVAAAAARSATATPPRAPATAAPFAGLGADEIIARQQRELQQLRDCAEHLRFRVQEQDYELRGLRGRMRLWGEAHEASQSGENALCVVLEQLGEAERTAAALRAQNARREEQIQQLRHLHDGNEVVEYLTQLEQQLDASRSRESQLEAANNALREKAAARPSHGAASPSEMQRLRRRNELLEMKLREKKRNIKDLQQLLRLHLTLRAPPAESRTLALVSGSDACPAAAPSPWAAGCAEGADALSPTSSG